MKMFRLIHDNTSVIDIIEAQGFTCSSIHIIFEGTIDDIKSEIERLKLTTDLNFDLLRDG